MGEAMDMLYIKFCPFMIDGHDAESSRRYVEDSFFILFRTCSVHPSRGDVYKTLYGSDPSFLAFLLLNFNLKETFPSDEIETWKRPSIRRIWHESWIL